jgi:hypothetical protein
MLAREKAAMRAKTKSIFPPEIHFSYGTLNNVFINRPISSVPPWYSQ